MMSGETLPYCKTCGASLREYRFCERDDCDADEEKTLHERMDWWTGYDKIKWRPCGRFIATWRSPLGLICILFCVIYLMLLLYAGIAKDLEVFAIIFPLAFVVIGLLTVCNMTEGD